jgi:carboxylesterase
MALLRLCSGNIMVLYSFVSLPVQLHGLFCIKKIPMMQEGIRMAEAASLLIHGFTGGEFEIEPLNKYLEEHNQPTKTFTLQGHTGNRTDLVHSTRHDWIQSAEDELKQLLEYHQKVNLIGFSTGALIAIHLSVKYKERIHTLTLLSAPVFPLNTPQIIITFFSIAKIKNYIRKLIYTPFRSVREFKSIVRESFDLYDKIDTPTLIIQGNRDHLVKTESAHYLYTHICTNRKRLLIVEKGGHLICKNKDNKKVFAEVLQFIEVEQPKPNLQC